jgi:Zn-dependent metalloprotease
MTTSPVPVLRCSIVPPYLLARLARAGEPEAAESARRTVEQDRVMRERREVRTERGRPGRRAFLPTGPAPDEARLTAPRAPATRRHAVHRSVYDAGHGAALPGALVRAEDGPPTADRAVTEAYDGLGATWSLFFTAYQRDSLDGRGLPLVASVHYDTSYDNAFWDGAQMVFGDGDGTYLTGFTSSIDVVGHELTHGVTQFAAGLTYVGQTGALNESVSDVFGSLVKQMSLRQGAAEADWLIGAGLFTPRVKGVALRSMKAPGTAYDDPVLGRDPQPATMDGFEDLPHDSAHDNGGVHTNSGIPNHAFYLAATAIGGSAWEGAGRVWYDVLTGTGIAKDVDFTGFAGLTVSAAGRRFGTGSTEAGAVAGAWSSVGVLPR